MGSVRGVGAVVEAGWRWERGTRGCSENIRLFPWRCWLWTREGCRTFVGASATSAESVRLTRIGVIIRAIHDAGQNERQGRHSIKRERMGLIDVHLWQTYRWEVRNRRLTPAVAALNARPASCGRSCVIGLGPAADLTAGWRILRELFREAPVLWPRR